MKNEEYYRKQIRGLKMILQQNDEPVIYRSYILEKLNRILEGGINFHPSIERELENEYE